MNYHLLDEKIQHIRNLPQFAECGIDEGTIDAFAHAVESRRGWDLVRINPIEFADRHDIPVDRALDLFVIGAKAGLFTFEWSLLCPLCGGREHSYGSLDQFDKDVYHCSLCNVDAAVEADDRLEVSFSVPQAISGEWPDPYVSLDEYWSYFFSSSLVRARETDDTLGVQTAGRKPPLRFIALPPGKKARIRLDVNPALSHRLVSLDTHSAFTVRLKDDPDRAPEEIALAHTEDGFDRSEAFAPLVPTQLVLTNRSRRVMGYIVGSPDPAYVRAVVAAHPPRPKPFCSGKMMLNHQTFRDLFLEDNLPGHLSLKINDITLLFADLTASTARSGPGDSGDRAGGVRALFRVREHFQRLRVLVRENRGGIVKTTGNAIMASFNAPLDAVRAAARLLAADEQAGRRESEEGIGLRIGLHRGPVIAVTANRTLDFFGRTVTIASRVQDLAGAGEIWLTDDVMRDPDAAGFLRAGGYSAVAKDVALKGVGGPVKVYSCQR